MSARHLISSSAIAIAVALLGSTAALAATPTLPTGGTFSAGSGSISTSGSTESVSISTAPTGAPVVINWNGFSVGAGGTVSYAPGTGGPTSGTVVNVDNSGSVSTIDGTISSPDYAQVVVNPNGISVGATASLPASTELAAGTLNPATSSSPVSIAADKAPVTIAKGATFAPPPSSYPVPIDVTASSGDTLPDEAGMQPVNVTVPAGQSSSFTLQPGQTGSYDFVGPRAASTLVPSSPSNVSITGPAGGTVGSLNLSEPMQLNPAGSPPATGTLSVSNVDSTGTLEIESGQGVTLSGTISAAKDITAAALKAGAAGPNAAPASSAGALLTIDPGTVVNAGNQANLQGNSVTMSGALTSNSPDLAVLSNQKMTLPSSADASISDTADGSYVAVQAPSLSNLDVSAAGSGSTVDIASNDVNGVTAAGGTVMMQPAAYEATAPDYQPMSIDNVTVSTGDFQINGGYGVSLNGVTQTLPAGTAGGTAMINGANSVGLYANSTNASNTVSITNSTFDVGQGFIQVTAGVASGSTTKALPGAVTITGSTMKTAGGMLSVVSNDGGSIDVGSGTTLSADEGGACSGSGAACSTLIQAKSVDFKTGNAETASGSNQVQASSSTGAANADPAITEVAASGTVAPSSVALEAPGGAVTVSGTLDAGKAPPPPVTSGSTGGSTAPGSTTPPATGGPTGATKASSSGNPAPVTTAPAPTVTPVKPAATPVVKTASAASAAKTASAATISSAAVTAASAAAAPTAAPSVSPVTVEPSSSVTTTQQQGSTVLVPVSSTGDTGTSVSVSGTQSAPSNAPATGGSVSTGTSSSTSAHHKR